MRKITLTVLFLFTVVFSFAQTIVSTSAENKNAILEEYTGIHCGYCPQGHAIAESIKADNPNDFYIINVHVGGYAVPGAGEPDFRTPYGTALDAQAGVSGYPMGSVSRHVFSGSNTATSRGAWAGNVNQIIAQPSYVNVGVEAEIDVQTKIVTVHVEAYYTGNSPLNTNLLNVALLQNNTKGPQAGGNAGNNYNHQHRLVDMITGQWGETITETTAGTFVDRTFTYSLPDDYNGVSAEEGDLEVVAFVTESHQEIVSANGTAVTIVNALNNDVMLKEIYNINKNCTGVITPKIAIQNRSASPITSLAINYNVNSGASQVYNWSGQLESFSSEEITLPEIPFSLQENNTLSVSFPLDDDNSNNSGSVNFDSAPLADNTNVRIEIRTDNYGSETTWELINLSDNSVVVSGGPYSDVTGGQLFTITQTVEDATCYKFKINDGYGDGMCCGYGTGFYKIYSDSNLVVEGGSFGVTDVKNFEINSAASISNDILETVNVYPNPANSVINIDNAEGFNVEIINVLGRVIFSSDNLSGKELIDVVDFDSGAYFVKLKKASVVRVEKIIILK